MRYFVTDPGASGPGTSAFVLNQLAALYDALATLAPRAICIPLTAATGWNLGRCG